MEAHSCKLFLFFFIVASDAVIFVQVNQKSNLNSVLWWHRLSHIYIHAHITVEPLLAENQMWTRIFKSNRGDNGNHTEPPKTSTSSYGTYEKCAIFCKIWTPITVSKWDQMVIYSVEPVFDSQPGWTRIQHYMPANVNIIFLFADALFSKVIFMMKREQKVVRKNAQQIWWNIEHFIRLTMFAVHVDYFRAKKNYLSLVYKQIVNYTVGLNSTLQYEPYSDQLSCVYSSLLHKRKKTFKIFFNQICRTIPEPFPNFPVIQYTCVCYHHCRHRTSFPAYEIFTM